MFMQPSRPLLCDSRTTSYFDRPTPHISRYRSDDSYTSTTSSTMAMTRKRPRMDSSHYNPVRTPRLSTSTHNLDASTSSFGLASPSPLANSDYHLFGGLDTPGTWSEQREERARIEDAERDYRQNRYSTNPDQSFFSNPSTTPKSQDDSNTDMTASTTLSGWHLRRTAWALTGGLAGKIFNFCWNTTFRGFQAGGGQSYTIHDADHTDFAQDGHRFDPGRSPRLGHQSRESLSGNPTQAHHQPFDYRDRPQNRNQPYPTPTKKPIPHRYPSTEDSAVKNNWVFVETTPLFPGSEEHSPVRKRSRASVASPSRSQNYTNIPQPQPTTSSASRTYTASFASPRPTRTRTTSLSSRTYSYNTTHTHSRNNSYTNTAATSITTGTTSPSHLSKPKRPRISMPGSPSPSRTSLLTSSQKPHLNNQTPASPISPEMQLFHRKRRKEAQSLKRLNAQLQDMIREGQEALGSRVEVFEYGDAESGGEGMGGAYGDSDGSETEMDADMDGSYFRGGMR